jgi:hypothetical protein
MEHLSNLINGLVLLLFVPDWQAPATDIASMWAGFLADIKALNEKLLVVEHLSLAGATSYMQNHYIAAKGIPLFPGNARPHLPRS